MATRTLLAVASILWSLPSPAATVNPWADFRAPAPGGAQAIGAYQAGCLRGAQALAASEPGIEVMRPERRRYYGHPTLIDFLRSMGRRMRAQGHGRMLVGDLSMPRGGPTLTGHVSHQTGLDADVWFWVLPDEHALGSADRQTLPAPSYVDAGSAALSPRWRDAQDALVRFAAESEAVERVLVNPSIKRHLCRSAAGDRAWLGKVRPWWGHADHMHVRLRCPRDSAGCRPQAPPPAGDGCDASLDWWFSPAAAEALAESRKRRAERGMPVLPAACDAIADPPDVDHRHRSGDPD